MGKLFRIGLAGLVLGFGGCSTVVEKSMGYTKKEIDAKLIDVEKKPFEDGFIYIGNFEKEGKKFWVYDGGAGKKDRNSLLWELEPEKNYHIKTIGEGDVGEDLILSAREIKVKK